MRNTTAIRCLLLTGLGLASTAAGAANTNNYSPLRSDDQAIRDGLNISDYSLQDLVLPEDAEGPFFTIVTLDGVDVTLELYPSSLRGDEFRVMVQDDTGALTSIEPPRRRTFRGSVSEAPESTISASLLDGGLSAMVNMPDGKLWVIQPASDALPGAAPSIHVVYRGDDILPIDGFCGVDLLDFGQTPELSDPGEGGSITGTGLTITDIGIDADYEFFLASGSSVSNTVAFIENVMNNVAVIYERDVQITYELTTIIVRTSSAANPYTSSNPVTLINQFAAYWATNHRDVQRDVAHLFTGRNMGGTLGIAFLPGVCSSSIGFGVVSSYRANGNAGKAALSAHEIGHNYNAGHCSGFSCKIMCAGLGGCGGIGLPNFSAGSISSIVSYRNTRSCLATLRPARPIPYNVDFLSASLNPWSFSYGKGVQINEQASNEPSPPYSIELNTAVNGYQYDDDLRTVHILLGGQSDVILQYWTQHRGVEAGESLVVHYRTNNLQWVELNRVVSDGLTQSEFDFHHHALPSNAYHDKFRVRFFTVVNERNDDFFIDKIRLAEDPTFSITIDAVGVTDVPIEVWPAALFGNTNGITPFGRLYVLDAPLRLTAPPAHQGEVFREWRIDGKNPVFNLTLETTVTSDFTAEAVYGDSCDPCDMNCDGDVNAFDIEPFLDLLFGPDVPCDTCTGDVNGDGTIDAFDIEPFLNCLFP